MTGSGSSFLQRPRVLAAAVLLALGGLAGCGQKIDVKQDLAITDLTGGYYDAGIKDGKNKLVPTLTFRIEKKVDAAVRPLSLNIAFKKVVNGAEEDFEDVFVQSVAFAEGNRTAPLTARSETGFTGDAPQSRADMLKNTHFVDLRAVIFAKHSSSNWVEIGRYDLPRTLITR